jgi:hypothetical protein
MVMNTFIFKFSSRLFTNIVICAILFFSKNGNSQTTYYKDIYPIILKNCVNCHRSDGYGPFSLTTYDDIQKRSQFIKHVITNRIMPPWNADNHYRDFANNRSLSDEQIKKIINWIDSGSVEGVKPKIKENITYGESSQLPLKVDLKLRMKEPFTVKGINQNTYICYKIPYEIKNDTFASAIEFVAGNKSIVHHASYQILEVADDVDITSGPTHFVFDADTLNRVTDDHDFRFFNLIGKDGKMPVETYHGGWLPGTTAQVYQNGIGIRIPKKGVLLIRNFHYSPTPIETTDLSGFNIFFTRSKISRTLGFASFKPQNPTKDGKWFIKANDSNFVAHINVKFYNDVSLLNINPHMHRLGKTFLSYVITPTKDTIQLIKIPNWDHNWQEFYRFKKMIKIPKGSVLHAEAKYDNSEKNLDNPYTPPKDIMFEWGMNEDSEMMRLVLLYLPYQMGDEIKSLK